MPKQATFALASVLGFVAIVALSKCGAPTVVDCRVRAALAVPLDDPDAVTVGDVKALAQRLKACSGSDAGL